MSSPSVYLENLSYELNCSRVMNSSVQVEVACQVQVSNSRFKSSYKSSCKFELTSTRLHVKLASRVTSQVTNRVELKSQV
jgi:hypothetical protein